MTLRPYLAATFALLPTISLADAPKIVVDILPLHSLVARVMEGVGTPDLLISGASDPHHMHLRPSEARALSDADIIFAIGAEMTPWLPETLDSLSPEATRIYMLDAAGTKIHANRTAAVFEDDHDDDHHEDGDHDEHGDEDHHDEKEEHHDDDHHNHGDIDPHAWLDQQNIELWMTHIAETLATADPDNAQTYRKNAQNVGDLDGPVDKLADGVATLGNSKILVLHDAYQYMELGHGLPILASVKTSDADKPGPARLQQLREDLAEHDIACVFTEPGAATQILRSVLPDEDTAFLTVDPLGRLHEPGGSLIFNLFNDLAVAVEQCGS